MAGPKREQRQRACTVLAVRQVHERLAGLARHCVAEQRHWHTYGQNARGVLASKWPQINSAAHPRDCKAAGRLNNERGRAGERAGRHNLLVKSPLTCQALSRECSAIRQKRDCSVADRWLLDALCSAATQTHSSAVSHSAADVSDGACAVEISIFCEYARVQSGLRGRLVLCTRQCKRRRRARTPPQASSHHR